MKTTIGELTINELLDLRGKRIRLGKQKNGFVVGAMTFQAFNGRTFNFFVCFYVAPSNRRQMIAKQKTEIEIL